MMHGIQIFKKVEQTGTSEKPPEMRKSIGKAETAYALASFLLSRAVLFGQACPFGVAFFAASFQKEKLIYAAFGIFAGCLSAGAGIHTVQYVLACGILCLFKLIADKNNHYDKKRMALVCVAANFVGALTVLFFEQFILYSLLSAIIECVILYAATVLFLQVDAIQNADFGKMHTVYREEVLGTVLFAALCLSGIPEVVRVGEICLREVGWGLLILTFAYVGGSGGGLGAGVVVGLIASMSQTEALAVVGLYAACGLAAGLVQRGGKACVASCWLLSAVGLGAQSTVFTFGQLGLANLLVSAILFLFLPRRFFDAYFAFEGDGFTPAQQRAYSNRINSLISEKFDKLEKTFIGLSETVESLSERFAEKFRLRHARVVDEAVGKVCAQCSMKVYCWEKETKSTQKSMERATQRLKTRGYMDVLDFDDDFRKRCIRPDALVLSMNQLFSVHRLNAVWDSQLNDTRVLLGRQYRDFAGIMQGMQAEITQKAVFEGACKTKILRAMAAAEYPIADVYLYEREDESYDAELVFNDFPEDLSVTAIEKAVSQGMERCMRVAAMDEYSCHLRLEPLYNFVVSSSIAMLKKDGEQHCGDSYAVFNIKDNRCVLILSDGMGSGAQAAAESKSAVSLLRNLLTVGFNVDAAVRLVNSALVLKSGRESFATIDMAVIDLLTGETEFVKIGAACSYIKQNSGVTVVQGSGLPLGILPDTAVQKQHFRLEDGDCVILVSDGIAEHKHKEGIADYIDGLSQSDNEQIAKDLLGYGIQNSKGKVLDDATVIVAKIVKSEQSDFV